MGMTRVFYKDTVDWLPVFDVYYCEGQYNADEFMLEEFGFEEYEPAIPAELESYVNAEELRKLWNEEHNLDAVDFIQDLVRLLNTFLVFDVNNVEEDIKIIYTNRR